MPLPNFLIIGAQKAGTTWLSHQLRQHPDIYLPPSEVHYFDKRHNYEKGLSWYRTFFEDAEQESAIGEKTPDYYWTAREGAEGHLPHVHRNIYEALPDAKLILIVREPVSRAISAVNHLIRTGRVSPRHSIDQLLVGEKHALVEPHGIIDYGRYHRHIQNVLKLFDREQLLVLVFEEDIVDAPDAGLRKVTDFLGVDSTFSFHNLHERQNPAGVSQPGLYVRYYLPLLTPIVRVIDKYLLEANFKQRPSDETIRTLRSLYRDENEKLYAFLGRRIPSWTTNE